MPTLIVALLVIGALALLATSLFGGRRDRDPSTSVHHFRRAMTAMGNDTPQSTSHVRSNASDATSRGEEPSTR